MIISRNLFASVAAVALSVGAQARMMDRKAVETAFDAGVSSADQLEWLKAMSSAPNQVGSAHDKANADYMLGLFKSWGWNAHIETYQILFPTPISTTVELIAPDHIQLGGQEPAVPGDDTSYNTGGALPPYVSYQGDGDVTADLVYVNYGMPDDYEALARRGIDVKGKIVIARYGVGWRGLKPLLAQWHGAAGCIIYSDPAQDGYAKDDVYPKGGMRPPFAVQRGSVMDTLYAGDPLTPGVAATATAKRLTRAEAKTLLKIPVLPMSYGDAAKLLSALGGPTVPNGWQGALPFTYHIGSDGQTKVHLAVKSDWSLKPIYNVIATVKGATLPDQWVIRGNHHDAWVMGAGDPLTGNVAMMSEMKAIGGLLKQGWRPARTLVYASWDGEEPAALGSTEWAEQHADELKRKGVIYVNTDSNGRGFFNAGGSHDFQHLVNQAMVDVTDPETGANLAQRARARILVNAYQGEKTDARDLAAAENGGDLPIAALGLGSDFAAYLHFLGLPSLDIGFGGEDESAGVYHSLYDSFHHVTTFDDPGLKYGAALSKVAGRIMLRVADADTPTMRFGDFADTVAFYYDEVAKLVDKRREEDRKYQLLVQADDFRLAANPLKLIGPPPAEEATPRIDLAALTDAVDRLKASARAFDAAYADKSVALPPARRAKLNGMLRDIDQLLLDERGLPGRPWFKNLIYAPGRLTGYGAKTLPGVREAIEDRRFDDANVYATRTAQVIESYAKRLDEARAVVEGR